MAKERLGRYGFIGLELAAAASALGAAVTVLELGPRLMGRAVPARIATAMAARHVAAGIDIRCGTAVTGITVGAGGSVIGMADGTAVEVDVVVAGVGATPDTSLAERAGLATDDGILVDARLATSAPYVFAAGDCCRFPHPLYPDRPLRLESWRAAQEHGTLAARNMLGAGADYDRVPWFWSDQHDLSLQVSGLTTAASEEVVRGAARRGRDLVRACRERSPRRRRRSRVGQHGGPRHPAGRDAHRQPRHS